MFVLGLCGSLRRGSHNRRLLHAAAQELVADVEFAEWRGLESLPPYDEDADTDPAPPNVAILREAVTAADALLIATPEYNASVPGALKNALDWVSRPFPDNSLRGKPVAVIGASTSLFGAVWAQAELRKVLKTIGAEVIEHELAIPQVGEALNADGTPDHPAVRDRLRMIVAELTSAVNGASELSPEGRTTKAAA